ncbi:MAG: DUF4116 domain-containing protein [Flavobacteriia bacterium]|jgi:hypothetical protein
MWFLKILLIIVLVLVLLWLFVRFATKNIIEYHSNGRLKLEGESFFNRRNGVFKLFDEDGNLVGRWHYEKGQIIKQECINPTNGKVWKTTRNSEPKVVIELGNADKNTLTDKKIVLQAIKYNPSNLQYVKSSLANDLEVVMEAVQQDGLMIQYAGYEMKNDYSVAITAINQNGRALEYLGESLRNDLELVLVAVTQNGNLLRYVCHALRDNKQVALTSVRQNGYSIEYIGPSLIDDTDIVLEAVKQDGRLLRFAGEEIKQNKHVVLAAIKQNGLAIQYADQSLKKDREILLNAVMQNGLAIQYADQSLKLNREVLLNAVMQNGFALSHADQSLKIDREIVKTAIQQNGYAIEFADQSFLTDKSLLFTAINHIPKPRWEITGKNSYGHFITLVFQNNQDLMRKGGISSFKLKIVQLLEKFVESASGIIGKESSTLFIVLAFVSFGALVFYMNILWNHPWEWGYLGFTIIYGGLLYMIFLQSLYVALNYLTFRIKKRLILQYLKSDSLRNTIKPS